MRPVAHRNGDHAGGGPRTASSREPDGRGTDGRMRPVRTGTVITVSRTSTVVSLVDDRISCDRRFGARTDGSDRFRTATAIMVCRASMVVGLPDGWTSCDRQFGARTAGYGRFRTGTAITVRQGPTAAGAPRAIRAGQDRRLSVRATGCGCSGVDAGAERDGRRGARCETPDQS